MSEELDRKYMARALQLALRGAGHTRPNPMVGAVLVKDGRIIGEGWHKQYDGPHAEVNAFASATEDPEGATLYVSLEPCSHYGKTPPCADLIIRKKVARVVAALEDPNPLVSGRGFRKLRANGIRVTVGVLAEEARHINDVFLTWEDCLPYRGIPVDQFRKIQRGSAAASWNLIGDYGGSRNGDCR